MSMINAHQTHISLFFPHPFFFFCLWLSLADIYLYVCIPRPVCLALMHPSVEAEVRGSVAAAWQQPVSSVNDLWRVSRCVSLGSFRFVSTELYLRAPFMRPQVWLPSLLGERRGGWGLGRGFKRRVAKFPNSPCGGRRMKAQEQDGAVKFVALRECGTAKTYLIFFVLETTQLFLTNLYCFIT